MENKENNKGIILLDKIYSLALDGVPLISESIEDLAGSYKSQTKSVDQIIDEFVRNQRWKCTTAGFMTGVGGMLTLPVTLSADLTSSLYMQLRMIAGIAYLRGYNVRDDQVKTCVYLALCGKAVSEVLSSVMIQTATQYTAKKIMSKVTGKMLTKINQKIGFRFITKAGSKGVITISKMVPVVGGVVGGVYNDIETRFIAKYAKKMFNEQF